MCCRREVLNAVLEIFSAEESALACSDTKRAAQLWGRLSGTSPAAYVLYEGVHVYCHYVFVTVVATAV